MKILKFKQFSKYFLAASFQFAAVILLSYSCSKTSDDIKPKISLLSFSKDTLKQGDLNQDSVFISFRFEDGDGDLGWGSSDLRRDIFVMDDRTNLIMDQFKIPDSPSSNGKPITGQLTIRVYTTCCIFPNQIPPCTTPPQYPFDSLTLDIYLKDRAGNESNHIKTPRIILRCE